MNNFDLHINPQVLRTAKESISRFANILKFSKDDAATTNADAARKKMVDDCCAAREKNLGGRSLTTEERKQVETYVDKQIAAQGPGATAASVDPTQLANMKEFCSGADEEHFAKEAGAVAYKTGPVMRAVQDVPNITQPNVYPKPKWPKDKDGNPVKENTKAYRDWVTKRDEWMAKQGAENERAKKIEAAIALGAMVVDQDPDNTDKDGKPMPYIVQYIDQDGVWHKKAFYNSDNARKFARRLMNTDIMSSEYTTPLPEDTLAAIATGVIKVRPMAEGNGIETKVSQVKDPNGDIILDGDNEWHTDTRDAGVNRINAAAKGYQKNSGTDYKKMDGKISEDERKKAAKTAASAASTNGSGKPLCPVCGLIWDVASAKSSQMVVRTSSDSNMIVPSNPKTRAIALINRSKRYDRGYTDWYRVTATKQLVDAALDYHKGRLTDEEVQELDRNIRNTLETTELVASYVEQLDGEYAISTNPDRRENIQAIKNSLLSDPRTINVLKSKIRISPRGKTCPMCGQIVADDVPIVNPEAEIAETTYKGNSDAKTYEGFKGQPYKIVDPKTEFFRESTQQAVNPFTHEDGRFTTFSYRPTDNKQGWPPISIAPASFQCVLSFQTVLDQLPYVTISEYFMRNNIGNALNLFQAVSNGEANKLDSKQAGEVGEVKSGAEGLIEKIKGLVEDIDMETMVLSMPFIFYHRLKGKVYGNIYKFPYLPEGNIITQSSNKEEWGGGGILSELGSKLQGFANGLLGKLGMGIAKPFPAPTWTLPESGWKWNMKFTLNFINDEFIRARNNYMCANTIIHNNRWIQKTIIGFPGALYEIMLPTGVRELMCTGSFTLNPIGVPRHVPPTFFEGGSLAQPKIGSEVIGIYPKHGEDYEVVPDAYSLTCELESAIAENLNNSIFAYYMNIETFAPGTTVDNAATEFASYFSDNSEGGKPAAGLWASAAQARISTDTGVSAAQALDSIAAAVGAKTEVDSASNDSDEDPSPPKDDSDSPPTKARAISRDPDIPDSEHIKRLYTDTYTDIYRKRYADLKNKLSDIRENIRENTASLESLKQKRDETPLGELRKVYIRRIQKLSHQISNQISEEDALWSEMIALQMEIFQHGKTVVEERTRAKTIAVPKEYFVKPTVDPVEEIRIRFMTTEERKAYIEEKNREIAKHDKWGIASCPDFYLRAAVATYILDLIVELEPLIRDAEETDTKTYDELSYRKDMLWSDFNTVVDPKIPFILNRTNLVYIPYEDIPDDFKPKQPETQDEESSTDIVSVDDTISTEVSIVDDNGDIVPVDNINELDPVEREELIKKHRAEVIKMKFGSEEGLIQTAYQYAMDNNTDAQSYRWGLIYLKSSPELEDYTDPDDSNNKGIIAHFNYLIAHWDEVKQSHSTWTDSIKNYITACKAALGEEGNVSRVDAIATLTKSLYTIVGSSKEVLLNNALIGADNLLPTPYKQSLENQAMKEVDASARKTLSSITDEFRR